VLALRVARAIRAILAQRVLLALPVRTQRWLGLLGRRVRPVPTRLFRVRRAQPGLLALRVLQARRVRGVFAAKRALLARREMLAQPALKGLLARRVILGLLAALVRRASLGLAVRQVSLGLRVRKAPKAFRASRVRRAPLVCRWIFRARSRRMRICRRLLSRVTPMWWPLTGNSTFTTARRGLLMVAVCLSRVRLARRAFRVRRD
jgi:hypothetical protein